jgi:transcriptional regulator GlxA family with amidase domain
VSGRYRIGILVFDGADELDVIGPYRVLSAVKEVKGLGLGETPEVLLVSEEDRTITLGNGLRIVPDLQLDRATQLDVLLLPGGSSRSETAGRRVQQRNPVVIDFIKKTAERAQVVGSVCTGAFLLAEAGLLAGRRGNTHWFWRGELQQLMAERGEPFELLPERVVWDGEDLVTGGGVTSGIDIALELVERLYSAELRSAVERALEIETPTAVTS